MPFVTEEDFEHLPRIVTDIFITRRNLLKERLKMYQLDAFFLSDAERRSRGTIRAYIESFHFDKFSPTERETGGKYVSFCEIFRVCITLYCKCPTRVL